QQLAISFYPCTTLFRSWFVHPTCVVAADLIGKVLCRQLSDSDGKKKPYGCASQRPKPTLVKVMPLVMRMLARARRVQRLCIARADRKSTRLNSSHVSSS